jgi:hypothetical protein
MAPHVFYMIFNTKHSRKQGLLPIHSQLSRAGLKDKAGSSQLLLFSERFSVLDV